jgi:hypothetical protein
VPTATGVTTPVPEPIVAIPVDPLLHEPPRTASVKVVDEPMHTCSVPPIVAGNGFTVTTSVTVQPVTGAVYVMVAVPAETPVTMPDVPIVAIPVLPLLQEPPEVVSLSVVVAPWHMVGVPVMAPGSGSMIIVTLPVILEVQPVAVLVVVTV